MPESCNMLKVAVPPFIMANKIKGWVSKKKRRYQDNGFDLDLTYITGQLIAMGFPADKLEGVYRNHIDDVVKFLQKNHNEHYHVYNLCSERFYDEKKFSDRVLRLPFDDHNPPRFSQIEEFCTHVHDWLRSDPANVAAVHCKAGKGRTGVMICSYLIKAGDHSNADAALAYYDHKRTRNDKGVTIPSQRRYVYYYDHILQSRLTYRETSLQLLRVDLEGLPNGTNSNYTYPWFIAEDMDETRYISPVFQVPKSHSRSQLCLPRPAPLVGDVKLVFFNRSRVNKKEKLFHFWVNPFFVLHGPNEALCSRDSVLQSQLSASSTDSTSSHPIMGGRSRSKTSASDCDKSLHNSGGHFEGAAHLPEHYYTVTFTKNQIDRINKDKANKICPANLQVTLYFACPGCRDCLRVPGLPLRQRPAQCGPTKSVLGPGSLLRCSSDTATTAPRLSGALHPFACGVESEIGAGDDNLSDTDTDDEVWVSAQHGSGLMDTSAYSLAEDVTFDIKSKDSGSSTGADLNHVTLSSSDTSLGAVSKNVYRGARAKDVLPGAETSPVHLVSVCTLNSNKDRVAIATPDLDLGHRTASDVSDDVTTVMTHL